MASDEAMDGVRARDALAAADRAGESARRVGRRWARRYLLGFGVVSAGSVVVVWALSPWVPQAFWGLWYAAFAVLLAVWLRRQPVRAVPRVTLVGLIVAWSLVFGSTMAFGMDHPVAYPIGAITGFAVWALGAWWVGR